MFITYDLIDHNYPKLMGAIYKDIKANYICPQCGEHSCIRRNRTYICKNCGHKYSPTLEEYLKNCRDKNIQTNILDLDKYWHIQYYYRYQDIIISTYIINSIAPPQMLTIPDKRLNIKQITDAIKNFSKPGYDCIRYIGIPIKDLSALFDNKIDSKQKIISLLLQITAHLNIKYDDDEKITFERVIAEINPHTLKIDITPIE